MSEMVERLAKAMLVFNSPKEYVGKKPDGGWSSLLDDKGRDYWRSKARHMLETMRVPTEAMLAAVKKDIGIQTALDDCNAHDLPERIWRLMIDEAKK